MQTHKARPATGNAMWASAAHGKRHSSASQTFLALAAVVVVVLLALSGSGCEDEFSKATMVSHSSSDSCLAGGMVTMAELAVEVTVEGLRIHVVHRDAIFNCCLDVIVVGFSQENNLLILREREVVTVPCDCVCPFKVEAAIEVASKGTYVLEIYSGDALVWRGEVVV